MTGVEASEIRLGVAVFGRVSGFPWWPAVVSKCEPSGEWRKDGKFWVRFFNDHTGSWLKSSEIRSFDDYNTDRCLEHNHKVPKFRRYSDRVYKACSLAEKYISSPKRIRIRVLGPRGTDGVPLGDEQEVISISAADAPVKEEESDPSGHATEHRKNNYARSGKSAGKRKRNQPSSDDNSVEEEPIENKPTRRGSKSTAGEERTKRKRVRSLRYVEYMSPMEARMAHRQIGPNVEHNGKHSHNDTDLGLLDYSPPMGLQSEAERHLRRPKTNDNPGLSRKLSLKSSKTTSERSTEKRRVSGRGSLSEGSLHILPKKVEPKLVKPASERSEESQDASTETRRARSSRVHAVPMGANRRQLPKRLGHPTGRRRSVRSRADCSFVAHTPDADETDSEENAERVRKVVYGSLEAVAEDLVEHAVRQRESPSRIWKGGHVLDGNSMSLGGSELLCSILNRVSDLERDVALLQKQSTVEEKATLGEDPSAAGLKSAVEALASATAVFAKVREYDSLAISRSLDLLWADGHFPLQGADGELLRTVARSLVLASCRRRHAERCWEEVPAMRMSPIKSANKKSVPGTSQFENVEGEPERVVQQKSDERNGRMDDDPRHYRKDPVTAKRERTP